MYGWSDGGTQYRLALDTTTRARSLVGPEQQALANVYSRWERLFSNVNLEQEGPEGCVFWLAQ